MLDQSLKGCADEIFYSMSINQQDFFLNQAKSQYKFITSERFPKSLLQDLKHLHKKLDTNFDSESKFLVLYTLHRPFNICFTYFVHII